MAGSSLGWRTIHGVDRKAPRRHRGGARQGAIGRVEGALKSVAAAAFLSVALAGCFGGYGAPVLEPVPRTTRTAILTHVVQRGDTLYSIAWDAGVDYRDLAGWNDIAPPYLIRPGQTIRLRPGKGAGHRVARTPAPEPSRSPAPDTGSSAQMGESTWVWPVKGPVIRKFSRISANPGIDIAGKSGETVKSAADGRVVYTGDGLRGYGELIIVKHNDTFLSAYAHNRKILVQEGDQVRRGQPIAEMGSTGTNRVKLHFEIRENGVAVNPLQYLPKS